MEIFFIEKKILYRAPPIDTFFCSRRIFIQSSVSPLNTDTAQTVCCRVCLLVLFSSILSKSSMETSTNLFFSVCWVFSSLEVDARGTSNGSSALTMTSMTSQCSIWYLECFNLTPLSMSIKLYSLNPRVFVMDSTKHVRPSVVTYSLSEISHKGPVLAILNSVSLKTKT